MMTPVQKRKHAIILRAMDLGDLPRRGPDEAITADNIDSIYKDADDASALQNARDEALFVLTDEEKAATAWMELDDAIMGKLVKKTALGLMKMGDGHGRVWWFSAAMLLCGMVANTKTDKFTQELLGGADCDDWLVTIQRIRGPGAVSTGAEPSNPA
jgi:hypothetical protein